MLRAMNPGFRDALEKGIELFNRREFYEAHEAWEAGWIDELAEERRLLQGLIQVAAGFYKLQVGSPQGTVKLLDQALNKLRDFVDCSLGVDLRKLIPEVEHWLEQARKLVDAGRADYHPELMPVIAYCPDDRVS
jgi:predicted metal-dependent hydrolase